MSKNRNFAMSSSVRLLALALLVAILAAAFFFTVGNDESEDNKSFPPHSVQQ